MRLIRFIPIIALLLAAGTAVAAPAAQSEVDAFPLSTFGLADSLLVGPVDAVRFTFSAPAYWEIVDGMELRLDYAVQYTGPELSAPTPEGDEPPPPTVFGIVQVFVNDVALEPLTLDELGEGFVKFLTVPAAAFAQADSSGLNRVEIVFTSDLSCDPAAQVAVTVRASSELELAHLAKSPAVDLRLFPSPLYRPRQIRDEAATLVVADQASETQLQAALTVAAGLGQLTDGELSFSLVSESLLFEPERRQNHLVFVGPFSAPGAHTVVAGPDDGIVEMIVSPWNPERVMLIVTGNSDAGILKAARAVSAGRLQASGGAGIAVVAEAPTPVAITSAAVERSFADLGYAAVAVEDIGGSDAEFEFFQPAAQAPAGAAFLDLVFNHSSLLDFGRSQLLILLNGERIGSIQLDEKSALQGQARISLPALALRAGNNRITVRTALAAAPTCTRANAADVWLTIRPESVLQIPFTTNVQGAAQQPTLADFPDIFTGDAAFAETTFMLASDPIAWGAAGRIAFDLGFAAGGRDVIELNTLLNPAEVPAVRNVIVVGQPNGLASLAQLNSVLPVAFEAETNEPVAGAGTVYRLPEGASAGYLQILPRQPAGALLAVLGADSAGLRSAAAALTTPALRAQLDGNFGVVNGEQLQAAQVEPAVSAELPLPTVEAASPAARPTWLLPLLYVSSGLMLLVILIALVGYWRARA